MAVEREQRGAGHVFVLEQDDRRRCRSPEQIAQIGTVVVSLSGGGLIRLVEQSGSLDQPEDSPAPVVDGFGRQLAGGHRGHDGVATVPRRPGHLEIESSRRGVDRRVRAEPVGHDQTVEAPLLSEDGGEQRAVLATPLAIDLVVGRHHGPHAHLSDRRLERSQVELSERPLGHLRADRHPLELRVVGHEVLDGGTDALALYALDVGHSQPGREERILAVALEVSARKGRAVQVDGRGENELRALRLQLAGERGADLAHQLDIPRRPESGATRKARRRRSPAHVGAPYAGGAVAHLERGNSESLDARRVPPVGARHQPALFVQREKSNEVLDAVGHGRTVPARLRPGPRPTPSPGGGAAARRRGRELRSGGDSGCPRRQGRPPPTGVGR